MRSVFMFVLTAVALINPTFSFADEGNPDPKQCSEILEKLQGKAESNGIELIFLSDVSDSKIKTLFFKFWGLKKAGRAQAASLELFKSFYLATEGKNLDEQEFRLYINNDKINVNRLDVIACSGAKI